ncbi:MAG: hypothetical protein WD208_03355 [Dehalococcoidia bacterium]
MADFWIDIATAREMRAAAEVKSRAVMTAYRSVIPPALFDPQRVTPDRLEAEWNEDFEQLTDDGRVLVAKDADGSIIGVCLCRQYDNALPANNLCGSYS